MLAVASHRNNSNSQLIRVYDIKQRKFELFCHHIHATSEIVSNTMKFTMLNNRWILIAFNKRNPHKDYYINNVFELIDLQERKIRKRSQTLTLILPKTFKLNRIYATINNNNQQSMYIKIVTQFTRNMEHQLSLETYKINHVPIVLIQLINYYYFCSAFQIWFCGTSTTNKNGWAKIWQTWRSDKFKKDVLIYNYDDLWY